jgi:Na+/H+-dicarboxylate symporter
MLYSILAVIFVAQAYGVTLDAGTLVIMGLVLMVASKGIAAVPRASLVVVASALSFFHLPEGGLLLIVAIDQFCDMARAATNVVGNAVASVVVARWEGALATPQLHGDIG